MSNFIRSCRSGSEWTANELIAFNIEVVNIGEEEFFGESIDAIELSEVLADVLEIDDPSQAKDRTTFRSLRYLDLAMQPEEGQESDVDVFAVEVLRMMNYEDMRHIVCIHKDIKLLMCGQQTHAKMDVCVLDMNDILLLIQEDKSHINRAYAEPQMIAEAIAAFQVNNL